jgi:hypothetical protein
MNMKMWLATMLLLTGFHPANAEPVVSAAALANPADYREVPIPSDYTYTDPEVGSVRVQIQDVGEPAKMPLRMTVTATCLDKRAKPNADKPQKDLIINAEQVCYFGPYMEWERNKPVMYDSKNKLFFLHYSKSPFRPGQSKCNRHLDQVFDLRDHCSQWQQ